MCNVNPAPLDTVRVLLRDYVRPDTICRNLGAPGVLVCKALETYEACFIGKVPIHEV